MWMPCEKALRLSSGSMSPYQMVARAKPRSMTMSACQRPELFPLSDSLSPLRRVIPGSFETVGFPRKLRPRKAGAGSLAFAGRYSSMFIDGPFSFEVK